MLFYNLKPGLSLKNTLSLISRGFTMDLKQSVLKSTISKLPTKLLLLKQTVLKINNRQSLPYSALFYMSTMISFWLRNIHCKSSIPLVGIKIRYSYSYMEP